MSWTKKVVNPAKILEVGDEVEAIVSELDMDQRRISLSLRQTERNPWEELEDTHPEGSVIEGKVRNLTEFGAFVEITDGIDGLIHVSDMSWTKRVKHPSEVLKKGDTVKARITNIDVENQRVSLSIKEFMPNEWEEFADKHQPGDALEGKVVNVTDFGLFIDIYNGLEGLAHVSEIEVPAGAKLEDYYKVGDWVRTRILRIEEEEKKVGLSMRGVEQPSEEELAELQGARPGEPGAGEEESRGKKRDAAKEPERRRRGVKVVHGTRKRRADPRRGRPPSPCRQKGWEMTEPLKDGMTKAELVEEVARTTQLTKKHAEIIVNTVFDSIVHSLKDGEKIELRGFGSFRIRHRGARTGRNPKTGDKVKVPPKRIPYFKPGKELRELLNDEC